MNSSYTYISEGEFGLVDKPKPVIMHERDAIVKVTLASICSSDLHIKHGSVPRAVKGITVGHEMVGIVETIGSAVTHVKPGDRVTVNVETFCGECFFCRNGYVNNCTDQNGGWALGCRIDGGQAEYVRVPFADQGLNKIPDGVTDRQALLVGDVLATGYWATKISEIKEEDTVLIIGAGNLTFKTGGVDGCDCEETLRLIGEGKINTEPLITHTYSLDKIEEAYYLFENKIDHVIKVAIEC